MAKLVDDPRAGGGGSVNERLQSLAIRHGVSIERMKSSEVAALFALLSAADAELLARIEARLARLGPVEKQQFGFGRATTERAIALRDEIKLIADQSFETVFGSLAESMLEIGKEEIAFQAGAIAATVTVRTEWLRPSNSILKTLIRARPFSGEPGSSRLLSEYARTWSMARRDAVTGVIRNAIILGETVPQTTRRVWEVLDNSKSGAERIARTAIAHIANAARQATYEANADVLKGLKWTAVLDSRTCVICASLDGKVFPVSSGPRPPVHFQCRCIMVPVTRAKIGIPVGKRSSSDGEVPGDITFDEWLMTQPKSVQEEILGVAGHKLWLDGKLPLDGFVDRSGRRFTLDELRARNLAAFRRAGL